MACVCIKKRQTYSHVNSVLVEAAQMLAWVYLVEGIEGAEGAEGIEGIERA
jgi:hypothetical protein